MKIYEIGTGYTPIPAKMGAATEIVVEELSRSFIKNGEDAEIIDIAAEDRGEIELPITEVNIPKMFTKSDVSLGIMHKLKRVVYSIALSQKLKNILKNSEEKIVLHFHNQYNMFFFLKLTPKKLRQKALIGYTVHSYIWGTEWGKIEGTIKKKYFQEVDCVKKADVVFVLNDITKEHFVTRLNVPEKKIYKILNGVNTERYTPLEKNEVESFKESMSLAGKKIIFQVGSVCDRKNQLGAVRMLAAFLRENKDVVYMYAGGIIDNDYQESIKKFAAENQIDAQVIYAGELVPGEILNKYYNAASCSVFTSNLESFGLVIIEAISSGTTVIINDNLMFDIEKGYEIYHNDEEFAELVREALSFEEKERCDRTEVIEKYSWDAVARGYSVIFKDGEGK